MMFSTSKRLNLALVALVSSFPIVPIWAAPIIVEFPSAKQPSPAVSLNSLLPSPEKAQADTFAYLQEKNGGELAMPSYPANDLLKWTRASFAVAGRDSQKLYTAIYGQLLVAQPLLADKDSQQRRRGLRVAHNASLKAATRLGDKHLTALIFDGFIVPYVEVASTGVTDTLSHQRLLQDASGAYRLVDEPEKRIAVLRVLLSVAESEKTLNQADWARVKLADQLAAQEQYQAAIDYLQAVTASNLSGSKAWIPELQNKLRTQQSAQKDEKTKVVETKE